MDQVPNLSNMKKAILYALAGVLCLGAVSCNKAEKKENQTNETATVAGNSTGAATDAAGAIKNSSFSPAEGTRFPLSYSFSESNTYTMTDMSGEPPLVYTGTYRISGDTILTTVTGLIDAKNPTFSMQGYTQKLLVKDGALWLVEDQESGKAAETYPTPDKFVKSN